MYYEKAEESKDNEDFDEVEDLVDLLNKVKEQNPDVQAVACGAILSNYQRLRVMLGKLYKKLTRLLTILLFNFEYFPCYY